jgi:hypothetical protein
MEAAGSGGRTGAKMPFSEGVGLRWFLLRHDGRDRLASLVGRSGNGNITCVAAVGVDGGFVVFPARGKKAGEMLG